MFPLSQSRAIVLVRMGIVDRTKRLVGLAVPEEAPYVCQACEVRLDAQYQVCPECGGYDIRRLDWNRED